MNTIIEIQSIDEQIASLQRQRKELLDAKRLDALSQVLAQIATFGFTASELQLSATPVRTKKGPQKREARYANPENPKQTWHGGMGPRPKWVKSFISGGGKLEDILINS